VRAMSAMLVLLPLAASGGACSFKTIIGPSTESRARSWPRLRKGHVLSRLVLCCVVLLTVSGMLAAPLLLVSEGLMYFLQSVPGT